MSDDEEDNQEEEQTVDEGYQTLAKGVLSPRHRKLAHLAAAGWSNTKIAKELGYTDPRVSILLKNQYIQKEVYRLQDKLFEETVKDRLKSMNEKALNHVDYVLTDNTHRVKVTEKNDIAKWLLEKTDGKAAQVHDVGENMLSVLMDRLDARKTERIIDSEEGETLEIEGKVVESEPEPEEKDEMTEWVKDFCGE